MRYYANRIVEKSIISGLNYDEANKSIRSSLKNLILDWLIDDGDVLIVFGPPCSDISGITRHIVENEKTLIIETFGDDEEFNKFINNLANCKIEFLMFSTPIEICTSRCPVENLGLLGLIYRWFSLYDSNDVNKLPMYRQLIYKPNST
jgi:hypothetical protein